MDSFVYRDQYVLHDMITHLDTRDVMSLRGTCKAIECILIHNKKVLARIKELAFPTNPKSMQRCVRGYIRRLNVPLLDDTLGHEERYLQIRERMKRLYQSAKTLEQKVMKNQTASIIETRACLKITRDKAAKAKYALRLTYDEQSEKDAKSPNDDGYALIKAVDRIENLLNIFSALMNTHIFIANLQLSRGEIRVFRILATYSKLYLNQLLDEIREKATDGLNTTIKETIEQKIKLFEYSKQNDDQERDRKRNKRAMKTEQPVMKDWRHFLKEKHAKPLKQS